MIPKKTFNITQGTEIKILARIEVDETVSLRPIAFELEISHQLAEFCINTTVDLLINNFTSTSLQNISRTILQLDFTE